MLRAATPLQWPSAGLKPSITCPSVSEPSGANSPAESRSTIAGEFSVRITSAGEAAPSWMIWLASSLSPRVAQHDLDAARAGKAVGPSFGQLRMLAVVDGDAVRTGILGQGCGHGDGKRGRQCHEADKEARYRAHWRNSVWSKSVAPARRVPSTLIFWNCYRFSQSASFRPSTKSPPRGSSGGYGRSCPAPQAGEGAATDAATASPYGRAKTTIELWPRTAAGMLDLGQAERPGGDRLALAGEDHDVLFAVHLVADGAGASPCRRRSLPKGFCRCPRRRRASGGSGRPRTQDRRRSTSAEPALACGCE